MIPTIITHALAFVGGGIVSLGFVVWLAEGDRYVRSYDR